ncbi:hypothetical protein ACJX0J_010584, partial [Zea mays]
RHHDKISIGEDSRFITIYYHHFYNGIFIVVIDQVLVELEMMMDLEITHMFYFSISVAGTTIIVFMTILYRDRREKLLNFEDKLSMTLILEILHAMLFTGKKNGSSENEKSMDSSGKFWMAMWFIVNVIVWLAVISTAHARVLLAKPSKPQDAKQA